MYRVREWDRRALEAMKREKKREQREQLEKQQQDAAEREKQAHKPAAAKPSPLQHQHQQSNASYGRSLISGGIILTIPGYPNLPGITPSMKVSRSSGGIPHRKRRFATSGKSSQSPSSSTASNRPKSNEYLPGSIVDEAALGDILGKQFH